MRHTQKRSQIGGGNTNKSGCGLPIRNNATIPAFTVASSNPRPEPDSMDVDSEYGGSARNKAVVHANKRPRTDGTTSDIESKPITIWGRFPVEILAEIFKYLRPTDLLSLIRCKPFREYLMNKKGFQSTWWAVMKNVRDLPKCPPGFSEPQYLTVLFSDFCTNCGGTDKSQIDETLLVRLCSPCQEQCLALLVNTAQVPVGIREFVPKSNVFGKARRGEELPDARVLKSDVDRVIRALGEAERSGDENILAEWMKDMEEAALERKKRSKYITRALAFYQNELDWEKKEIQTKRRREIERRCIVILEFEREDLQFTLDSPKRKEYYKLLEKPELLSDREWEEIRSTLVRLLRANRNRKARLAKKADNQRQLGCSGQFSILETDLVLDGLYQGEGVGLLGWSWE